MASPAAPFRFSVLVEMKRPRPLERWDFEIIGVIAASVAMMGVQEARGKVPALDPALSEDASRALSLPTDPLVGHGSLVVSSASISTAPAKGSANMA